MTLSFRTCCDHVVVHRACEIQGPKVLRSGAVDISGLVSKHACCLCHVRRLGQKTNADRMKQTEPQRICELRQALNEIKLYWLYYLIKHSAYNSASFSSFSAQSCATVPCTSELLETSTIFCKRPNQNALTHHVFFHPGRKGNGHGQGPHTFAFSNFGFRTQFGVWHASIVSGIYQHEQSGHFEWRLHTKKMRNA